ncbi:MAG TPA: DUF6265 family protein [Cyclobacteriaceae bacterium]|nr:DUF6265 family protein [Cyclobacteriaceae bacterium]
MKYLIILFLLMSSVTGFSQAFSKEAAANFKKVEWLIGTWDRTNVKPGRTSWEQWKTISQHHIGGMGVTMQGSDTVFVEKFSIQIKDNALYYIADVPENKEPVFFKLTEITSGGFVCENPQHDFPKKISYQFDGVNLKAQISGDGKAMDFIFKRR